jgi:hypothetical protein
VFNVCVSIEVTLTSFVLLRRCESIELVNLKNFANVRDDVCEKKKSKKLIQHDKL